jgi:predicted nucleic acid-binding Zn ribbon protein
MPTYLWKCKLCQQQTELQAAIADRDQAPDTVLGDCTHDWQRIIAPTSFVLEGGGWYSQGYSK